MVKIKYLFVSVLLLISLPTVANSSGKLLATPGVS